MKTFIILTTFIYIQGMFLIKQISYSFKIQGLQFFAFIITFIDSNEFHTKNLTHSLYNWIWTFPRDAHRDLYEDPMCSLQIVSCRYLDPVVRHIKGMPQCDKIYNKQNGSVRPSKQNSAFIRLRALYTEKCPLLFLLFYNRGKTLG